MALDQSHKRRLVFYSGGQEKSNSLLHEALAKWPGLRPRSMTYLAFSHENHQFYFRRIKKRYRAYGFNRFRCFSADTDFLAREMREALKSDVIYLAGGNTFYFLKHLRESGLLKELKKFSDRGGILAGLSAGAIIMTPNINLAGYPTHDRDLNEVKLKNLRSLGLVNFEFLPHYSNSKKTSDALIRYSKRIGRPVFACPDGSGVVINGREMSLIGQIFIFFKGQKLRLS